MKKLMGTKKRKKEITNLLAGKAAVLGWLLCLLFIFSGGISVRAATSDSPVVLVGGEDSSGNELYSTGTLIDCGNTSVIAAGGEASWENVSNCQALILIDNRFSQITVNYLGKAGNGTALFQTGGAYGGIPVSGMKSAVKMSEGEKVFYYGYGDDGRLSKEEGAVEQIVKEEGMIYVVLSGTIDKEYRGGPVLDADNALVGIATGLVYDSSKGVFLTIDSLTETLGLTIAGTGQGNSGQDGQGDGSGQGSSDQGGQGQGGDGKGGSGGNGDPDGGTTPVQSAGTPSLTQDSYFVPILLVVVIAAFVAMYALMKRKGAHGEDDLLSNETADAGGVKLAGMSGYFQGQSMPVSQTPLIIGRDPAVCNAVYPQNTQGVSGVHCKIEAVNGKILLTDLGSSYGTYLENGTKLQANVPQEIRRGERFYLADRINLFQIR